MMMTPAAEQLKRGLAALYLEVPAAVANGVDVLVHARITELQNRIESLWNALRFVDDIASEELQYAKVGTGVEVALRHIARRAKDTLGSEEKVLDGS